MCSSTFKPPAFTFFSLKVQLVSKKKHKKKHVKWFFLAFTSHCCYIMIVCKYRKTTYFGSTYCTISHCSMIPLSVLPPRSTSDLSLTLFPIISFVLSTLLLCLLLLLLLLSLSQLQLCGRFSCLTIHVSSLDHAPCPYLCHGLDHCPSCEHHHSIPYRYSKK